MGRVNRSIIKYVDKNDPKTRYIDLPKVIKEDYDGFSLAVDLNNLKKEQVIFSLKKAIEKIEKEN